MSHTVSVPILDVEPFLNNEEGAADALAVQLRHALTEVGFMILTGHDLADATVDAAFTAAEQFHALFSFRCMAEYEILLLHFNSVNRICDQVPNTVLLKSI